MLRRQFQTLGNFHQRRHLVVSRKGNLRRLRFLDLCFQISLSLYVLRPLSATLTKDYQSRSRDRDRCDPCGRDFSTEWACHFLPRRAR
jgi:hypothetical protein